MTWEDVENQERLFTCLQSPALRESVTFQRFLQISETISRKRAAGEDISVEVAEMEALQPAIEIEMRLMERGAKPS